MHIPGPWTRGKGYLADRIVTASDEQQQIIAEVWYDSYDREVIDANARLIMAAPDMLEALENVIGLLDGAASQHVRAVIAKATGG